MVASIQVVVTALIVAAAAAYAASKLMPRGWRMALAARAGPIARRSGLSESQVRRVEAKLSSGGACGSCESCRACAAPAASGEALGAAPGRRIPIRSS